MKYESTTHVNMSDIRYSNVKFFVIYSTKKLSKIKTIIDGKYEKCMEASYYNNYTPYIHDLNIVENLYFIPIDWDFIRANNTLSIHSTEITDIYIIGICENYIKYDNKLTSIKYIR